MVKVPMAKTIFSVLKAKLFHVIELQTKAKNFQSFGKRYMFLPKSKTKICHPSINQRDKSQL